MNNFLKIYEWFKQVDGHMLKIETENRSFEIPLSISIIPHLLGLQYVNFPLKRKLNTVDLMEYIKNQQFEDKDIFQMIDKNKRKSVNDRVNTFKYFLENLDKGILVQNTHPKTHIRSEDFIIESKDGKYLHLGLLNVAGLSNIENFEVIDTNIEKYLETYFQDKKDKYFSQSPYQEKIKSIEIRKPQQEQFVPFSFKELKEIDEQSHATEVAKEKAAFSFSVEDLKKFSPEQIYQIQDGLQSNVDVSIYAKEEFNEYQMEEIRLGLEQGLDVSEYVDYRLPMPDCDMEDMRNQLLKEKKAKENTKENKKSSLDSLISKKKEEIKQEEAAKSSPFPRKGEVER